MKSRTDISPEAINRLIAREPILTSLPPQETDVAKALRAQAERIAELELESDGAHSLLVSCANERADLHRRAGTATTAAQDLMQLALEVLPVDMPRRREVLAQIAALRALTGEAKT